MEDKLESCKALIKMGISMDNRDKQGNTFLHIFIQTVPLYSSNLKEFFQLFIDAGADINAQNENGYTVLYCAIINNQLDCIAAFLNVNANLSLQTLYGNEKAQENIATQATKNAATQAQFEFTKDFIKRTNNSSQGINDQDENGDTLLHRSIKLMRNSFYLKDLIKLLIDANINVNIQNKQGETALLLAITTSVTATIYSKSEATLIFIVKQLLAAKADPTLQTHEKKHLLYILLFPRSPLNMAACGAIKSLHSVNY